MSHKSENGSSISKSFREIRAYFREVSAYFREVFGELVHIFGALVHIFAWKLVSRTSQQVSRNLGPSWQPGVYNDTNQKYLRRLPKVFSGLRGEKPQISLLHGAKPRFRLFPRCETSGTNMTGRPGHRTMEVNGGSSVSYLARTPCVDSFVLGLIGLETGEAFLLTGGASLLTVKLLCLQSLKALFRRTFPL